MKRWPKSVACNRGIAMSARRIRREVESASALRAPRRRAFKRAVLSTAACLAVLVLLGLCFPSAAMAVASFFGINYTPTRYMTTLPGARTSIPAVEEVFYMMFMSEVAYHLALIC